MRVKFSKHYKSLFFGWLSISVFTLAGNMLPVQSQITPDQTLDEESSTVTPNVDIKGIPSTRIDGGATRGANLFHSFSEFNVGEGQGAYFTNPAEITNILSRVTGGNPSEILGRLGVTGGDANLFLINPNGIIFGENASLDVGGSFMATTANGIELGEEGSFNATQPQTSKLLSVNPSALFFNAVAAQPIVNRSQATGLNGETESLGLSLGLQVPAGKSLALVGGDVFLDAEKITTENPKYPSNYLLYPRSFYDGGSLTAPDGRIELGSVAGAGKVSIDQSSDNWLLGYEEVQAFGKIKIEGSTVDVEEGSAKIETGSLVISNGSYIYTGASASNEGGNLTINASESIEFIGTSPNKDNLLFSYVGLSGGSREKEKTGDINISTKDLILNNTSISNSSSVAFRTDNIKISNEVVGTDPAGNTVIIIESGTIPPAGNINIKASGTLLLKDSAIFANSSQSSGGVINITAREIRLVGNSDVVTDVASGAGKGGNINLTADSIVAFDDSDILASARDGQGGNINLNTPAFFAEGYQDSSDSNNLNALDGNGRVDINATGVFNGVITIPEVSFIQNNLATLPQVFLNTNDLIASSCIARRSQQRGSFFITGNDSLPTPTQSDDSAYPTGTVQTIPSSNLNNGNNRPWQKGDRIVEPTGIYRLANGELVMSRECSQ